MEIIKIYLSVFDIIKICFFNMAMDMDRFYG